MKALYITAAVVLTFFSFTAAGEGDKNATTTLQVEGRNVVVALPDGACAYDKKNPVDAAILGVLERSMAGTNQILFAFADCKDIEAQRMGREQSNGDYGQIMFTYKLKSLADLSRHEFVEKMTEFFTSNAGSLDDNIQKFNETLKGLSNGSIRINGARILGIIHSDPDMVQVGMMQSMQTSQKAMLVIGVITSTKLGVPISVNLYHTSNGADSEKLLQDLAQHSAAYVQKLIALNPDVVLPHADERKEDGGYRFMGLLLGFVGVIGAVIALVRMRRRPQ